MTTDISIPFQSGAGVQVIRKGETVFNSRDYETPEARLSAAEAWCKAMIEQLRELVERRHEEGELELQHKALDLGVERFNEALQETLKAVYEEV